MSNFLAIDPNAHTLVYAKFTDKNEIIEYGKLLNVNVHRFVRSEEIKRIFDDVSGVFIEGQFPDNENTTKQNIEVCYLNGAIIQYCATQNIPYTVVLPSKWQSNILYNENITGHRIRYRRNGEYFVDREKNKFLSRKVASNVTKTRINDTDVADAICLAVYAMKVKPRIILNSYNQKILKKEKKAIVA